MFICNVCLEKFKNSQSMFKSNGQCEICNEARVCNDIPSKYLKPIVEKKKSLFHEIIAVINNSREDIKHVRNHNVLPFERKSHIIFLTSEDSLYLPFTKHIYKYELNLIIALLKENTFGDSAFENDIQHFNVSEIGKTIMEFTSQRSNL